jgi:hypothetical protein
VDLIFFTIVSSTILLLISSRTILILCDSAASSTSSQSNSLIRHILIASIKCLPCRIRNLWSRTISFFLWFLRGLSMLFGILFFIFVCSRLGLSSLSFFSLNYLLHFLLLFSNLFLFGPNFSFIGSYIVIRSPFGIDAFIPILFFDIEFLDISFQKSYVFWCQRRCRGTIIVGKIIIFIFIIVIVHILLIHLFLQHLCV